MKIKKGAKYWSEPSNHKFVPEYRGYPRFVWVRDRIPDGAQVLDVGCNCGGFAQRLVKDKGCVVYGVDINDDFIMHCKERKPGTYMVVNFSRAPRTVRKLMRVWPRRFDFVTLMDVIEHYQPGSRENLVKNVVDHVVPGGTLIVTTPLPGSPLDARLSEHEVAFYEEEIKEMFEAGGVELVEYGTMKGSARPGDEADSQGFVFVKPE